MYFVCKLKGVRTVDFKHIVKNKSITTLMSSHIRNNSLSHAYIIEGPEGSGKKTIVKEICKALYCRNKEADLPCGNCKECRRVEDGYNTDIYRLTLTDKASISVNDIRELTDTLGYYPDDGDVKIYIIEACERMTPQAQNALLLSLEEPPSYVVFFLLTTDSSSLLETVRSRAQTLKTQAFSIEETANWLKEQKEAKNATEDEINTAAAISRGALGKALTALSKKDSKKASMAKEAMTLVQLLCSGTKADAIVFASGLKYSRAEFEQFFDYTIFALRDILASKYKGSNTTFYADQESARKISSKMQIAKISSIYNALISAKEDITKNNGHIYTVMMTLAASAF